MLDTILNLISDLKTCLAVALGSGFLLGYLYTKLRARELFKPDVKALTHRLHLKREKLDNIIRTNKEVELELNKNDEILNRQNLELTNIKSKLTDEEKNRLHLEGKHQEIKGLLRQKEITLANREEDLQILKTSLEIEDLSKISEHKSSLEKSVKELQHTYDIKRDSVIGLEKEKNRLNDEILSLKDKLHSLEAKINKKEFELMEVNTDVATIRDKFQFEYDKLISEKNSYEAKIERYKRQLRDIQKTL